MRSSSPERPSVSFPKISLTALSDFSGLPRAVLNSTTSSETSLSVYKAAEMIAFTSAVSSPFGTLVPVLQTSSGSSASTSKLMWIGASNFLMNSTVSWTSRTRICFCSMIFPSHLSMSRTPQYVSLSNFSFGRLIREAQCYCSSPEAIERGVPWVFPLSVES